MGRVRHSFEKPGSKQILFKGQEEGNEGGRSLVPALREWLGLEGQQLGKSPLLPRPFLTGTEVSGGCTWVFGFCCNQAACPLRGWEPGEALLGGQGVCLWAHMLTLSHMQHTLTYVHRPWGRERNSDTVSLDTLETQHGSFLFYLRKKKNIPFERKGS